MNEPEPSEESLFLAACRLTDLAQRAAFLDAQCRGSAELRRRLDQLLAERSEADAYFDKPPAGARAASPAATAAIAKTPSLQEVVGTTIGRYKLLQKIGEGGCGVVFMAGQEEPIRRKVALKVIKLGMDTREVIARFEAERQALALMDHPNIAKVLDAGATETGRPYFVMELVRGVRITDYCDQHHLPTRARLDLFTQVCHAIQHAHQKGIIHRDIKPSNILVTLHDGVPVPKVIDFGIAKATDQKLTDKTLFTQFDAFIGTPAYMSPEQAEMSGLDIDTRSDIYSLGVLLYELLTGKTPFDGKELLASGLEAMVRTLREREPIKPSTRLSTMADADLSAVARYRQTEPGKLTTLLRGDLDWIVMKALEKDRTRRYETANGLAIDIQRHLQNEPVAACPPTALYRFQKLVRRNKIAFAAVSSIVLVLLLSGLVSTWQALRATRAEREQSRLRIEAEKGQEREVGLRKEAEAAKRTAEEGQRAAEQAKHQALEILYASDQFLAERALTESNLEHADAILHGLQQAIERKPDSPELHRSQAVMLQRAGRVTNAIDAYAKTIEVAATSSNKLILRDALLRRSQLLRQRSRGPEAGIDERRAWGLPWQSFPADALPDYETASEVSAEYGATNRESGLYSVDQPDSRYSLAQIDGEEARCFQMGMNYAYFFIDPTFKWRLGSNALVRVEYRSLTREALGLHYDSYQGAYAVANVQTFSSTGKWQVLEFALRDARLQNSEKGRADFRLWHGEMGFYLKSVIVRPHQPNRLSNPHIPPRDPTIKSTLIDLTRFYNLGLTNALLSGAAGDNLSALLPGTPNFGGIQFDVRGVAHLSSKTLQRSIGAIFPREITNITVNQKARAFHVLHGAGYSDTNGATIGAYILHYKEGGVARFPIIYGQHLKEWWYHIPKEELHTLGTAVAWTGTNRVASAHLAHLILYRSTFENPRPADEIQSVDFVSMMAKSAPFLLAITMEDGNFDARTDFNARRAKFFPLRDPETPALCLNLDAYYNASLKESWLVEGYQLSELPTGRQHFADVDFDVRGIVQLTSQRVAPINSIFPRAVLDIPVGQKCERLHFLHGLMWNAVRGTTMVARYILHYEDGTQSEMHIRYGRDVLALDSWGEGIKYTKPVLAWEGRRPWGASTNHFRLYRSTWDNPRPEAPVKSIDFVSELNLAAPFLIGVTAQEEAGGGKSK